MNFKLRIAAAAILATCLVSSYGYAADAAKATKKASATAKKSEKPAEPSVAEQIEKLKMDLEGQINNLKKDLNQKDAQLKQAQEAASAAQSSAAKAQAAADAQQQAVSENSAAVGALKATVEDVKNANSAAVLDLSNGVSRSAKIADLTDAATGKIKFTATVFGDYSYYTDLGYAPLFIDNTYNSAPGNDGYNTFEITRTYFNFLYTPSDAVSVRITPDIYRSSDGSLALRLKYAYMDFNRPFAAIKALKNDKITFGQTQNPITDWEEGLTGHRYTYKMAWDFAGLSSTFVGVKVRGPVEHMGKTYLDYDLGVFTNAAYNASETNDKKQFMGRVTAYPFGTKKDRTGLGVTVFGTYGNNASAVKTSSAATNYAVDRFAAHVFYQTPGKGYLVSAEYDRGHNAYSASKLYGTTAASGTVSTNDAAVIGSTNNQQESFSLTFNARLGNAKSPFHAFGFVQNFQPNSYVDKAKFVEWTRTVGGIAYKFNKNLDISVGNSNFHWVNKNSAYNNSDTNAITVWTQYSF